MPWSLDAGLLLDSGLLFDSELAAEQPPAGTRAVTTRPVFRLLVLAGIGGAVIATFEGNDNVVRSGSVTADRTRMVRRRVLLSLVDDGSLTPLERGDLLYNGAIIRVERGIIADDLPEYLALGTFVVAQFTSDMTGLLELVGEDPLSLLAQPFGDPVVIAAGTPPEDALRTLWVSVLDPLGLGAEWSLDGGGRTMPLRVFLPDEDRLDAVIRYFDAAGLEVFADRLGHPLMRPVVDLAEAATVALVREFEPGDDAILQTLRRSSARRLYNRVVVESNSPTGPQVRAVATVDDPASPLHPDRIGLQTAPLHRTAQVKDQSAANALARSMLSEYAMTYHTVSGTCIPDLGLDAGDVVTITEPRSGTSGRYRLDTVVLPALLGSMSIAAGQVVPLLLTAV